MKTILSIALFMMTTIIFAQEEKNSETSEQSQPVSSEQNDTLKDNKDKTARTGYVKFGDIKGESEPKATTRKRVVVLKSNKQGDPNKE
tara:strand:- start:20564 stop:20827 length:264 start_codon:yes stop_codon:yes gene_type:complete